MEQEQTEKPKPMETIDDLSNAGICLYRDDTGTIRMRGPKGSGERLIDSAKQRVQRALNRTGLARFKYKDAAIGFRESTYGVCELCGGKLKDHESGCCLYCERVVQMCMSEDSRSRVVVIDTETTGLDASCHGVIEVAMVAIDSSLKIVDEFEAKMPLHDRFRVDDVALDINGYTAEGWASAIPHHEAYAELRGRIKPFDRVTGWNVSFDFRMLAGTARILDIEWNTPARSADLKSIATPLLRREMPTASMKLTSVTSYLNIPHDHAHSAMADVKATADVYRWYMSKTSRTSA